MEQKILEAAERMVREGGYNAFSFREIAKEVGIKSSSVHYHFPTKADLGAAVAVYYTDKFFKHIGEIDDLALDKKDPIKVYVQAFKNALTNDKRMCLCGMLGAEINGLPPAVAEQTKIFFERNIKWLTKAYALKDKRGAKDKAIETLALLEGAMILSNVLGNAKAFDKATAYI